MMDGVTIIKDETHNKRYIQIELETAAQMSTEELEDLFDAAIADSRKDDETIPFEEVVAELKSKGIIKDEL
ncbi:MAG: hypothetical protein WCO54_11540 [Bacteroidota bacterium]